MRGRLHVKLTPRKMDFHTSIVSFSTSSLHGRAQDLKVVLQEIASIQSASHPYFPAHPKLNTEDQFAFAVTEDGQWLQLSSLITQSRLVLEFPNILSKAGASRRRHSVA